ncbi:MAG TPA: hypothetical protein VIF40_12470 [Methylosinus sp.]|uniref:hypothetical protein n=1 Tax=Hyphomicrobiales TaxID=356 RepID=UPI002F956764
MNARFAICLILLAVAVGDARAQEGGSGTVGESIGKFFEGLDMRRPPPRPADFVAHSRTGETGYTPFAAPTPASDVKTDVKKSAARAAALEKELGAAAAANRARGARVKIPDAPKERRAETKRP